MAVLLPFIIGLTVGATLYFTVGWWGFWVVFPWIGFSISLGIFLMAKLPRQQKPLGRRIAILMVLPALLLFVPIANNENFQLEGIVLLLLIGYYSKGVIHYAVAKVFGPLIWGRGFCGWACWTAAVLDWLPIKKEGRIPPKLKNIRYVSFALSVLLPVVLVLFLNYDVENDYLHETEMTWMLVGNAIYYLIAIPMAFIYKDRRAFCKIACPVPVVMQAPTAVSLITITPTSSQAPESACVECGQCNRHCPMDVDVMSFISQRKKVRSTECTLCMECKLACPTGAIG